MRALGGVWGSAPTSASWHAFQSQQNCQGPRGTGFAPCKSTTAMASNAEARATVSFPSHPASPAGAAPQGKGTSHTRNVFIHTKVSCLGEILTSFSKKLNMLLSANSFDSSNFSTACLTSSSGILPTRFLL